jgi:hypothetical protein
MDRILDRARLACPGELQGDGGVMAFLAERPKAEVEIVVG